MAPRNLRHAADRLARASGLSAHEDRRLIRAAYAGILGRDPGDAEVAHWQAHLAEGMTWERFITLMRTAPEFAGGQLKAIAALDGAVEVSLLGGAPVGGIPVRADANRRLYFRPTWDALADNTCDVELWLVQLATITT